MSLKLYNSLTKNKEIFKPIIRGKVKIYSCGPTVYNYIHIGNHRTFLMSDFLKRALKFNKFKVKHIMNITDIGHLSSDADTGEDKMVEAAMKEKKSVWDIARFYNNAFKNDLKDLNIETPDKFTLATEHMRAQINMIKKLEKRDYTYSADSNIYFDTSKYSNKKLGGLNTKSKARVKKDPNKKNQNDFILWFTKSKFQDQEMKWNSPWGYGYPGWHIECSAMANKFLGDHIDIHTGGEDLKHIHHNNEIAQSEAALDRKPWVNYWLHGAFLINKNKGKMARSSGDFITLSKLKDDGFGPLDFRYLSLGTHYRKQMIFSVAAMTSAKNARKKLFTTYLELRSKTRGSLKASKNGGKYYTQFETAINDDLNIPTALAITWKVINDKKIPDNEKIYLLLRFDEIFGFNLKNLKPDKIPFSIKQLAEKRLKARLKKDFRTADKIRKLIKAKGFELDDTIKSYILRKK